MILVNVKKLKKFNTKADIDLTQLREQRRLVTLLWEKSGLLNFEIRKNGLKGFGNWIFSDK